MSKIALEGNAGGTGTFTITSPNSNNNRTLTLPDNTGTVLTTGAIVTEAQGGTGTTTGYYGFKNRIINGGMVIDQRNAGASLTIANTGAYSVDRWRISNAVSTVTAQRSTIAPTGFNNSLLITVTSADSNPPSAGTSHAIQYYIEGLNTADLGWGTANAQAVTLSFWVRSSLTGTYGIQIGNESAATRAYVAQYTINSANTFEYKTITIPGDTTGTWATGTGIGIAVLFDLGSGSNFQTASANTWVATDSRRISGNALFASTASATFYITGVQLERGSTATSFDFRPYGTELMLCQRYYQSMSIWISNAVYPYMFAVTKRAAPTVASTAGGFSLAGVTPSVDSFYASQTTGSQVTVTASSEL